MADDVRPGSTYKTLAEQREVLSPAEERFEKAQQTIGLVAGPIVFGAIAALLSAVISNTTTAAMLLSIGLVLIVFLIPIMTGIFLAG